MENDQRDQKDHINLGRLLVGIEDGREEGKQRECLCPLSRSNFVRDGNRLKGGARGPPTSQG